MCWLTWASWNSKSQATDENAGIGFVFYTLIFQSIYAHVSLVHVTLNPVCTNVCQSRFNGGRPVRPCVARRAWSGLESRKSRQRSETMNSYSANVASEISMRARNAARVLQKFRGGNGAAWIYLHTSYIHAYRYYFFFFFVFFFFTSFQTFLYHVCLPAATNHRPQCEKEERERERGIINRFRFRVRPCKMQSARDVAKLTFNFALDGLE